MTTITVYTAGPGCPGCTATKRKLTELGLTFNEVLIDSDPNIVEAARYLGLTQAPVVVAEGGHNGSSWRHYWAGYRPDRIKALVGA